ncbi:unnamed protein product [Bursaphelenchus xylophilus]|nr:unnamed protein product [Bursaphelenchus xylophilus]CAG9129990.1 unnamed protein product [Bursaphelenchus xylophilus]
MISEGENEQYLEGHISVRQEVRKGEKSNGTTSDYSSGAESVDNYFVEQLLIDTKAFHPADILANTIRTFSIDSPVFQMAEPSKPENFRTYRLVLTGGPCGGKTTGQERLATFFENAGWKVFTVPETATVLLGGGVKFAELSDTQSFTFQRDLLSTLIRIEEVFFNQASLVKDRNVLIICDRGAMDPSAYMPPEGWNKILDDLKLDPFELRENRYNQVVHMVTAADGAENYYTLANNAARSEGLRQALEQDRVTRNAWVGHPYVDVVDNSEVKKFDDKILKLISVVCDRVGLEYQDRLAKNSRKRKWLVREFEESRFPRYEEFDVTHDYLLADKPNIQVRIRTRCQNGRSTYTITTRQFIDPEPVETRMQITEREYQRYLTMKDTSRATLHKKRRCFNFGSQYFHMDVYVNPLPPACNGHPLIILETYTIKPPGSAEPELPSFLTVEREITSDPNFSMYELSKQTSNGFVHHNKTH